MCACVCTVYGVLRTAYGVSRNVCEADFGIVEKYGVDPEQARSVVRWNLCRADTVRAEVNLTDICWAVDSQQNRKDKQFAQQKQSLMIEAAVPPGDW
eukprot:gene4907-5988_t